MEITIYIATVLQTEDGSTSARSKAFTEREEARRHIRARYEETRQGGNVNKRILPGMFSEYAEGDLCDGALADNITPDRITVWCSDDRCRFFEATVTEQTVCTGYHVSDKEMISTLEAYCNTGRGTAAYRQTAEAISSGTHRAIQGEIWQLVREIVRAFASGRYDQRNAQAHHQAELLQSVLETR